MIQTEIAVLRFGLGARPGDLAAAAGDPPGWLMGQIKGAAPLAGNTPLAASDEIFTELLSARGKFREMKREAAAQSSADPYSSTDPKAAAAPAFNPVRNAYLPHYRAQVLARAQSAALTTRPFAERLVHFWTNHFAVSADKASRFGVGRTLGEPGVPPPVHRPFVDLFPANRPPPTQIRL